MYAKQKVTAHGVIRIITNMKYENLTSEQLRKERRALQKLYYNPLNRTIDGKQTAESFKEYGEKIYEIGRILISRGNK